MTNRHGLIYRPSKPTAPTPVVTDCDTCDKGCHCDSDKGEGCEHWCCWGKIPDGLANTCHAVPAHRAHMHAGIEYRKQLHAYHQSLR